MLLLLRKNKLLSVWVINLILKINHLLQKTYVYFKKFTLLNNFNFLEKIKIKI